MDESMEDQLKIDPMKALLLSTELRTLEQSFRQNNPTFSGQTIFGVAAATIDRLLIEVYKHTDPEAYQRVLIYFKSKLN